MYVRESLNTSLGNWSFGPLAGRGEPPPTLTDQMFAEKQVMDLGRIPGPPYPFTDLTLESFLQEGLKIIFLI